MELAQEIRQYYLKNAGKLSEARRFHLASRLAAWEGDQEALNILEDLRSFISPADIGACLKDIINTAPAHIYALKIRDEYFKRYPAFFGLHNAFFRLRHLKEIYGRDARDDLIRLTGRHRLQKLYEELIADEQAFRILARFAIDYIYLYEILFDINPRFDASRILKLKNSYDLDDSVQLHLFIYLYTHAIIADSNFYIRELPQDRLAVYRAMLEELEGVIAGRQDIKLDNKFEYLVASRICGKLSPLTGDIYNEAGMSLSSEGAFIIDRLNNPLQNSFSGSEHRNALFIMSSTDFQPHKTLIG